jgi:hypothetical protein
MKRQVLSTWFEWNLECDDFKAVLKSKSNRRAHERASIKLNQIFKHRPTEASS